jgi:hypothetical protein
MAMKPPANTSEIRFGIFIVKRSFAAANAIATGKIVKRTVANNDIVSPAEHNDVQV